MSKTSRDQKQQRSQRSAYDFRGHSIEILREPSAEGEATRLRIDGHDVHVDKTDDGYHSHAFMFKTFGSPYELAEELVKQWGDAVPKPSGDPHHGDHDP